MKTVFITMKTGFTTMKTDFTTMKTVFYFNKNWFYYNENYLKTNFIKEKYFELSASFLLIFYSKAQRTNEMVQLTSEL